MGSVFDLFRLDGRVALITGGGRGLGAVIARALADAGADIALASRSASSCEGTASEIAAATGRKTHVFTGDVSVLEDVERMAGEVEAAMGSIDILVNSAGINIRGNAEQLSEADWDAVVDTNLKGPFLMCRAIGPRMAQRGWGRIINLASVLGTIALAGRAPYCSSKSGVLGLTRVLALEWAASGVTVNALCPGVFGTELNRPLMDDPVKYKEFVSRIPLARWGELHEIAGAALFLASPAASYVTGSAMYVDGGWSVW